MARAKSRTTVEAYQNHQRAWHSEIEAGKCWLQRKECPEGAIWTGCVSSCVWQGGGPSGRASTVEVVSPSPANQSINRHRLMLEVNLRNS